MLAELGYKQELQRSRKRVHDFAISFSIISILAGCFTSYAIAMNAGGPIAISIGWPLVGAFVLLVALAMAEILSADPTAGGLYFWAGRLARQNKRVWARYVGWFNFLGEVAATAAIDYGAAVTWMALLSLFTGIEGLTADASWPSSSSSGCTGRSTPSASTSSNCSPTSAPGGTSWAWRSSWRSSPSCRTTTRPCRGRLPLREPHRLGRGAFLIGLLMAQYTYTGFDASAHVAEETINASTEAPKGLVRSVWVSILAGWVLLVAVTAAIQDYDQALGTDIGLLPPSLHRRRAVRCRARRRRTSASWPSPRPCRRRTGRRRR